MIAYLDASVILRVVFGEPGQVPEWSRIDHAVSSTLSQVECLRVIDRARLRRALTDEDVAERRMAVLAVLERAALIPVSPPVLRRASDPFPTSLGTLDAIHLASALLWQQSEGARLELWTHDGELGQAARAMGLAVRGCG